MAEQARPVRTSAGRKTMNTSSQKGLFPFIYLNSLLHLRVNPFDAVLVMLGPAIEVHRAHVLRASLLPGVAVAQPIISLLNLSNDINSYEGEGQYSLTE